MDDCKIVQLFFARSEEAIIKTSEKYGGYCHTIAYNILHNHQDSEECVSDTYWKAWHSIPPQCPKNLSAFLGKITRNLALDHFRRYSAKKRGGTETAAALDELENCLRFGDDIDEHVNEMALINALNDFLESCSIENRKIFMRRYWYMSSIKEIATDYKLSESKVKMSLLRSRNQLKAFLDKEGVFL